MKVDNTFIREVRFAFLGPIALLSAMADILQAQLPDNCYCWVMLASQQVAIV